MADVTVAELRWHVPLNVAMVVSFSVLFVALLRVAFNRWRLLMTSIPESALLLAVGVVFGFLFMAFGIGENWITEVDPELLFLIVLPPVIFEAGWKIERDFFRSNFTLIMGYALAGTLLNAFLIGIFLFILRSLYQDALPFFDSLSFGSLIAAVDPVAVIAIFSDLHVNPTLYVLIVGESTFNDGVSIVFCHLFIELREVDSFSVAIPFLALARLLCVILGGIGIGLVIAAIGTFCTRFTGPVVILEPVIVLCFGYAIFVLAETVSFSGVMALTAGSLLMSRYASENISTRGLYTFRFLMRGYASTVESMAFVYIGIVAVYHFFVVSPSHRYDPAFNGFAVLFTVLFRGIVIGVVTTIVNLFRGFKRGKRVGLRSQFILWSSGLRGIVSVVLALSLPPDMEARGVMMSATLIIVFLTVFLFGIALKPTLLMLRIPRRRFVRRERRKNPLTFPPRQPTSPKRKGQRKLEEMERQVVENLEVEEHRVQEAVFEGQPVPEVTGRILHRTVSIVNSGMAAIVGGRASLRSRVGDGMWHVIDSVLSRLLLRRLRTEENELLVALHQSRIARRRGEPVPHELAMISRVRKQLDLAPGAINVERVWHANQRLIPDRERALRSVSSLDLNEFERDRRIYAASHGPLRRVIRRSVDAQEAVFEPRSDALLWSEKTVSPFNVRLTERRATWHGGDLGAPFVLPFAGRDERALARESVDRELQFAVRGRAPVQRGYSSPSSPSSYSSSSASSSYSPSSSSVASYSFSSFSSRERRSRFSV